MVQDGSGDEDLAGPRTGRGGRFAAVLVVAAVLVLTVVRLRQDGASSPTAEPTSTPTPTAAGPVVPTFSEARARTGNGYRVNVEVGRHHTRATLYGPVPMLVDPCYGKECSDRHHLPRQVRLAMRVAVPGCDPVLNDLVLNDQVRRRSGRARVQQRTVLCAELPTTLVVNIVRLRSSARIRPYESGRTLVVGDHVHGPFTVQAFLQDRDGPHPKLSIVRALAADPRLLAGM